MEILIAVVSTVIIIGLIISLIFNIASISLLQKQDKEIGQLTTLTQKYMHDQQQMAGLFVQFVVSLNNFTSAIDDFTAIHDGGSFPFPPHHDDLERLEPWQRPSQEGPSMMSPGGELTDDEISKLYNLLTNEHEEEDEREDDA